MKPKNLTEERVCVLKMVIAQNTTTLHKHVKSSAKCYLELSNNTSEDKEIRALFKDMADNYTNLIKRLV